MATTEQDVETAFTDGPQGHSEVTDPELLRWYQTMVTSRRIDDREMALKRQNKIFFQISGAGHEGIQVALAPHLRSGSDWFFLYYRDRSLALELGQTPLDHFLQGVGAAADPNGGGRQMPSHFSDPRYNIANTSSPTGTQFLQAVGAAEFVHRVRRIEQAQEVLGVPAPDEIVVVCGGDGTTSEGEFFEAVSSACTLGLPVLFLIEDNGYAISVPVEVQTPGGSISKVVSGFPGLKIFECDGCDVLESHHVSGQAVRHVRAGKGPALLHAHVTRPYSHSMSDDERTYRTAAEREAQAARDPLVLTRALVIARGAATDEQLQALETRIEAEVAAAADEALTYPQPAPETAMRHLFSEEVDPTSDAFDTEAQAQFDPEGKDLTMVDLLNRCMVSEMERDPRMLVFGEDVADASRPGALGEVKGKGGVFKVTHGLQTRFGGDRVFNAPLAEANIVGRAIGMALRGLRPVVEIQFFDYIWPAMMQIRNELATMRYRSDGTFSAPVVIRATYGGYLKGGGIYHSQTGESLFAHTPGLRVVLPSNAVDAAGLLRTAIRCDDPVLFLEHKHLYRQIHNKGKDPGPDFMIPFGKAKVVRPGSDLTVVTCGALVKRSVDAAKAAHDQHGIDTEVIDLRTVQPFDMDTISESVRKTNKVVVVYEDSLSWGIGSEIAARIADELFPWLDGPVRRVASMDTWVAYAPQLEEVILPQVPDVLKAIIDLAQF